MKKPSLILLSLITLISYFNSENLNSSEMMIAGKPKVIDGDSIKIDNFKIRLFGIDAPEKKQLCKKRFLSISFLSFEKDYKCGVISTNALKKKIKNQLITCGAKSIDKYKRYVSVCYLKKKDLNKWMVKNGHAIAYKRYSKKYIEAQNYAKQNKLGLWQGKFIEPEKWRRIMD